MLASVTYNCWLQLPRFYELATIDQSTLALNLICNFAGAVLLFLLFRWSIVFLLIAFLDGAVATAWPIISDSNAGHPVHVPITVLSFGWPIAIIVYAIWLARRGVLR
ncbi:MAG: hypothetical protein ACREEB_02900 [Caulobacteraceae bacterium]